MCIYIYIYTVDILFPVCACTGHNFHRNPAHTRVLHPSNRIDLTHTHTVHGTRHFWFNRHDDDDDNSDGDGDVDSGDHAATCTLSCALPVCVF